MALDHFIPGMSHIQRWASKTPSLRRKGLQNDLFTRKWQTALMHLGVQ